MAYKVFIDGKDGTTGLKIYERFEKRSDIEILLIDEEKRKDPQERAKMINASDFTFLCLPDAAAIEAANLCTNPKTRILAQVSINDTVEADEITTLLMSNNVPPRRAFIMEEARYAKLDI